MRKHWAMKSSYWEPWRVSERYIEGDSFGAARLEQRSVSPMMAMRAALKTMESGVRHTMRNGDSATQLVVGDPAKPWSETLWMSDSIDEFLDHLDAIEQATGRVLVHGLGLGCYLACILSKKEVTHVDVVELSKDILGLIEPYFHVAKRRGRVAFHNDDAFKKVWPKGTRWDFVWHDIWPTICSNDLSQHAALKRMFSHRTAVQECWKHKDLLRLRRNR
jgi:hypothetical protein